MKLHAAAIIALGGVGVLSACGKDWPEDERKEYHEEIVIPGEEKAASAAASHAEDTPADPKSEADGVYSTRCAACHGPAGGGDGPGAAAVTPKPRNFTDAAWQASVQDDQIAKVIVEGGAAVGKSPVMPANPDLKGNEAVVKALVAKIRGFKG